MSLNKSVTPECLSSSGPLTKPNFLFVMVDELRKPPVYESDDIKAWRLANLPGQSALRETAHEFNRHYIGSTACTPSRATLFTGQYPSLHGVSQTDGLAKTEYDEGIFWLDPNTVPTMGDYLERNGYKTYYKGKWHISHADITLPGSHVALPTVNQVTGEIDETNTNIYLNANRLKDWGFSGWVGPEPHGSNPNNSASSSSIGLVGRDEVFADQVVDLIQELDQADPQKPWMIAACLVNPHDIALYGAITSHMPIYNFEIDPSVPDIPEAPTENEDLTTKPSAQSSYRSVFPQALQPIGDRQAYRKVYYSLEKYVDNQILKIVTAIKASSMYNNTIIIFTSDHGDQLGSHGGLFQKWHNVYEESLHVPCLFHNPILFPTYTSTDDLSSHVDLIPTMLRLAGISETNTQCKLKVDHCEVRKLVGRPLPLPVTAYESDDQSEAIYFWTQDNPTTGENQISPATGIPYTAVTQPASIEAVLVYLTSKFYEGRQLFKYARYYDAKDATVPNEFEMYNLTADPFEATNLLNPTPTDVPTISSRSQCQAALAEQRNLKMLTPTYQAGFVPLIPQNIIPVPTSTPI